METDLRFPTGKFSRPASFSDAERAAAIGVIAGLPKALRDAVRGLPTRNSIPPTAPKGGPCGRSCTIWPTPT